MQIKIESKMVFNKELKDKFLIDAENAFGTNSIPVIFFNMLDEYNKLSGLIGGLDEYNKITFEKNVKTNGNFFVDEQGPSLDINYSDSKGFKVVIFYEKEYKFVAIDMKDCFDKPKHSPIYISNIQNNDRKTQKRVENFFIAIKKMLNVSDKRSNAERKAITLILASHQDSDYFN